MLLLVFLIATLNLAIGYALGAGVDLDWLLSKLPLRRSKVEPVDETGEELTRPAATAERKMAPEPSDAPAAEQRKITPAEAMQSLSALRDKLSTTSVELKLSREDPKEFETAANKLQEANHAYLEEAEETIQQLDQLGGEGDQVAAATREVVAKGAGDLAEISGEIDGLIESGLEDAESRSKLIDKAQEARETAKECEQSTTEIVTEAEAAAEQAAQESATEFRQLDSATIDSLFETLEKALTDAPEETVCHVAAIKIDPVEGHEEDAAVQETLTNVANEVTSEILEDSQPWTPGTPLLAFLEGDDFEQATQRVEQLRQQFAATKFLTGDGEIKASVTCVLADAVVGSSREDVLKQVEQTLEESARVGTNRTFHHDGAFPTELNKTMASVTPRTVKV